MTAPPAQSPPSPTNPSISSPPPAPAPSPDRSTPLAQASPSPSPSPPPSASSPSSASPSSTAAVHPPFSPAGSPAVSGWPVLETEQSALRTIPQLLRVRTADHSVSARTASRVAPLLRIPKNKSLFSAPPPLRVAFLPHLPQRENTKLIRRLEDLPPIK